MLIAVWRGPFVTVSFQVDELTVLIAVRHVEPATLAAATSFGPQLQRPEAPAAAVVRTAAWVQILRDAVHAELQRCLLAPAAGP